MAFQLTPNPKFQAFDNNGNPLTGGKVQTYIAGTSNPVDTYTDSTGQTANPNPVVLDIRGEADIWLSQTLAYKFVLTDADDVEIWSVDNITVSAGGGGGSGNDEFVKVSGSDVASQYLSEKLVAGDGIVLTTLNPGAVEQIEIKSDIPNPTLDGAILARNTNGDYIYFDGVSAPEFRWDSTGTKFTLNGSVFDFLGSFQIKSGSSFTFRNAGDTANVGTLIQNGETLWLRHESATNELLISSDNGDITLSATNGTLYLTAPTIDTGSSSVIGKDPTLANEFATKNYVDNNLGAGGHVESSGILHDGEGILSVGTGGPGVATTFSITDGTDNQIESNGVVTSVSWSGKTDIAVTNIATQLITFVSIDVNGNVIQRGTRWTAQEARSEIVLGVVVHVNKTTVDTVNQEQSVATNATAQVGDVLEGLGFVNLSGNKFSPFSTNLQLACTSGVVMNRGINFYVNGSDNPHKLTLPVLNPVAALQYRMKNGTSGPLTDTVVNPNIWDDGSDYSSAPAVPTNKFTVQRIFKFTSNNVKLQPGQAVYNSLAEAKASIQTEAFQTEPSIEANGFLRGYLCIQEGTTDLSDTSKVFFLDPGKFGGGFGTGGLSVSTLQNTYDNSSSPEILTDSTRGALTLKRGSAADTDCVVEVQNGAGTQTFCVDGEGDIIANSAVLNGINAIQNLSSVLTQGNSTGANKFVFQNYTNATPVSGELWYEGSEFQLKGPSKLDGNVTIDSNNNLYLSQSKLHINSNVTSDKLYFNDFAGTTTYGAISRFVSSGTGLRLESNGVLEMNSTNFDLNTNGDVIANSAVLNGVNAIQDLDSVLTEGNTSTLGATFGEDIKGDRFIGIGDTARDNALTKWDSQSRLFPILSEKIALVGDNVAGGGSIFINTYYDGSVYKSLSSGNCFSINLSQTSGIFRIYGYEAAAADETITWQENFKVEPNGDVDIKSVLNLAASTNASPTAGDIWYDGTKTSVQDNLSTIDTAGTFVEIKSTKDGTWTAGEVKGQVLFYGSDSSGSGAGNHAWIKATARDTFGAATDLIFGTSITGGEATDALKIRHTGALQLQTSTTNASVAADGDIWFDGTNLKGREGGVTSNLIGGGTTKLKYQATTNIANITGGSALSGSYFATKIVPEADIDVDKFEYYVTSASAGKTVYCGIYDSAGTTLLGEASGNTDTTGEHETASISGGPVSLTGGTTYWLAVLEGSGAPNLGSKSALSDANLNRSAFFSSSPTGMPTSIGGGTATTTAFFIGVKA